MKTLLVLSGLFIGLSSCQKEDMLKVSDISDKQQMTVSPQPLPVIGFDSKGQTLLLQGSFMSAVHSTIGEVKIYEDLNKKKTLVFEGFKTDAGPDLRIYLAEDKAVTNFVQVTDKVTTMGSYSLTLPENIDLSKQNHVLIWCRQYAILFGSAQLR